jgi:hypothetical protein
MNDPRGIQGTHDHSFEDDGRIPNKPDVAPPSSTRRRFRGRERGLTLQKRCSPKNG